MSRRTVFAGLAASILWGGFVMSDSAWAQNANADVVVDIGEVLGPGCVGVDADGFQFVVDCLEHRVTHNDGRINQVHLTGRLPEGAALPDRAFRATIQELGFGACGGAANGNYVLTPSGKFSYNCRD
jgi:hypothetical protein